MLRHDDAAGTIENPGRTCFQPYDIGKPLPSPLGEKDNQSMDQAPERITILAHEFSAAALEFHRGKMAEKGYVLEGSITPRQFQMIEGDGGPQDLFDGKPLFAVTFRKKEAE
ncbi:hypothetical protein PB2503_06527 [Parvularcula bermudensis HTCC2503]|uniref:AMP nucleosidase n=2 Tax=Parvularcula TaxID=208215 RepID=E0TI32_PARBH|nr:hypothetical protein PB2503_06527 [Parvularcula bermudensis HTCC2503]